MIRKNFYWLIIVAFLLGFYVWLQTASLRMGYKVNSLRTECQKFEEENKVLRFQVNHLISMERLDRIAKDKKLITPTEKDVIYLN